MFRQLSYPLHGLTTQGLVEASLLIIEFDITGDLGPRREFSQDLALESAQDKGADQGFQPESRLIIVAQLYRVGKALIEALLRAQQPGIDKAEEIPQFTQVIFDGGAGGDDTACPLQGHHRLGTLGIGILEGLRLIGDDGLPLDLVDPLNLTVIY